MEPVWVYMGQMLGLVDADPADLRVVLDYAQAAPSPVR